MEYLISSVQIIDKKSPYHLQHCDLKLQEGKIVEIAPAKTLSGGYLIDASNLCLSLGWFDMFANIPETGFEHKESFATANKAAIFGGFTEVAVLPNALPVRQNKESIAFVKNQSKLYPIDFHAIAAATLETEGKNMTEMYDLFTSGAVAFSDGLHSIEASSLALNILQYLKQVGALFMVLPIEQKLQSHGIMHEGVASTLLGLKGMPSIAEKTAVWRFLELVKYADAKIHFSCISAAESVELIRNAKKEGIAVTCDIAAHQVAFLDSDLKDFDTNLKLNPPLRTQKDQDALRNALADGTIDAIVSAHQPQDEESKKLEFDIAEFGMIGLETAFAAANTFSGLSTEVLVEKLAQNPRKILGLPIPTIKTGETLPLTLFDAKKEWIFEEKMIASKSKNSPFVGKKLKGKAVGIFQKGEFILC